MEGRPRRVVGREGRAPERMDGQGVLACRDECQGGRAHKDYRQGVLMGRTELERLALKKMTGSRVPSTFSPLRKVGGEE